MKNHVHICWWWINGYGFSVKYHDSSSLQKKLYKVQKFNIQFQASQSDLNMQVVSKRLWDEQFELNLYMICEWFSVQFACLLKSDLSWNGHCTDNKVSTYIGNNLTFPLQSL